MIENLYEGNIIIYTFLGLGVLGVLLRLMLNFFYRYMIRESDQVGKTRDKTIKHMKIKFESCYKLKIGVHNVDTFVDKNVLGQKFCGLLLSTWENISGQVLYLCLLIVPSAVILGVLYDCGQEEIMYTGAVGILVSSVLIFVDKAINLATKKQMISLNLIDYFDNYSKVRLEEEASKPEQATSYREEYLEKVDFGQKELNRRKEARKKKEERRLEEQRKLREERKAIAAKRRERLKEEKLVKPVEESSEEIAVTIGKVDKDDEMKSDKKKASLAEEEKIIADILNEFFS